MLDLKSAILEPTTVSYGAIVLRMLAAVVLGGMIGFEREREKRAAGLRTHMLVALAAAVFAILTQEIIQNSAFVTERVRVDPSRILEAVTSGVAFLAAGVIIRSRGQIHGLTTGAGLWLAGALGTAAGLGYGVIAFAAAVLSLVIIIILRWFEPDKQSGKTQPGGEDG